MKCLKCGAWSGVLETRRWFDGYSVKRRHKCANDHVFWTMQVHQCVYTQRMDDQNERNIAKSQRLLQRMYQRDKRAVELLKTHTQREVGKMLGLHQSYISTIYRRSIGESASDDRRKAREKARKKEGRVAPRIPRDGATHDRD